MLSKSSPLGGRPNGQMPAHTRPDTSELGASPTPNGTYPEVKDHPGGRPRDPANAHAAHVTPRLAPAYAAVQTGPEATAH